MKYYLRRVRLNQGGYDRYGSYWGIGQPLYHYDADCDCKSTLYQQGELRASSREHAKVLIQHGVDITATFFN